MFMGNEPIPISCWSAPADPRKHFSVYTLDANKHFQDRDRYEHQHQQLLEQNLQMSIRGTLTLELPERGFDLLVA
jgi:hypothetical protein